MILIDVDKNRTETLFSQIVNELIRLIGNGTLNEGYQLPSSRQLAEKLGVNRSTVVRAYEELWSLGYVESTTGSYTRVRKRKSIVERMQSGENKDSPASKLYSHNDSRGVRHIEGFTRIDAVSEDDCIDFQRLEPDPDLIDSKRISACFREAISDKTFNLFGYCHPRGFAPLRASILQHMRLHSIHAADENIMITNGTQNSLQLIFQAFVSKDDCVIVESPTYSMLIPLIRYHGVKVLEVPLEQDGMDMGALEKIMKKNKVRLVYTMPGFHNPTGITMSQQKRETLLKLCEKHQTILVEDSFEEELKYFGKVHLPIKSMDTRGAVIYLSSFSKVLAPGFRIGWIIADKACINRLSDLKTALDLSSNTISQVMLHNYCKTGDYERHIRKLMRVFRKRMQVALQALKTHIPREIAHWNEPLGGFLIWLRIHHDISKEETVSEHIRRFGVQISDGALFFYTPVNHQYIRISISKCSEAEIEEGIKRLGQALRHN
jgi:DNA-binding transcriptional MocR family regulator